MISKSIILRFIRNGWWIILLAASTAVGTALYMVTITTPLYQSTTRYVISPNRVTLTDSGDMIYGIDALSRRSTMATYVEIFQSERAVQEAAAVLNIAPQTVENYEITAVVLPETSVIHLAVTGPNASLVSQLATAVGTQAVAYIHNLYDIYEISLLDEAQKAQVPISPNVPRTLALAVALGLLLGLLLALFRTPEILGTQDLATRPPMYGLTTSPSQEMLSPQRISMAQSNQQSQWPGYTNPAQNQQQPIQRPYLDPVQRQVPPAYDLTYESSGIRPSPPQNRPKDPHE